MFLRKDLEQKEKQALASYACFSANSKGRKFADEADDFRTCFQRDRDRIIHTKAFRRLKGKTQVFVAHHGDHYRSRLTHTMEVAQIARDMSRTFGLNEDLAESIALAHDLGHTPFGHAGEQILNKKMQEFGEKFEHNQQSLRIVQERETHKSEFKGLNLSFEVLEGMGKHETAYDKIVEAGALPSLEAQVVNLADEIAYHNHDLDDGLRSGIFTIKDLENLEIWKTVTKKVLLKNTDLEENFDVFVKQCVSKLIHTMLEDVYKESSKNLQEANIQTIEDVQKYPKKLIRFSKEFLEQIQELRTFLFQKFYRHPDVEAMNIKGQNIISKVFDYFLANPEKLPKEYSEETKTQPLYFVIKDYLAGMTDNFVEEVFKKI